SGAAATASSESGHGHGSACALTKSSRLLGENYRKHSSAGRKKRTALPDALERAVDPAELWRAVCLRDRRADGFHLRVKVQDFVTHFAAPPGLLVAAERQSGVEHVVAVDPDRAGAELRRDAVSLGDVLGPNPRRQTVLGVVGFSDEVVDILERYGGDDGPKDFLAPHFHLVVGVHEHGRL